MPDRIDTERHLYELIRDFRTAMLVSRSEAGEMHARPMAVAELRPDADAVFATNVNSVKVMEIEHDPRVVVTFQSDSVFATINGKATLVQDKAMIERLWSPAWKLWFPEGPTDPSLCLLSVDAVDAEYWDSSGLQGLSFVFAGLQAVLHGTRPASDQGQHSKVQLD